MPLYDYKCKQCGKVTEVRHGFDESHTDPCPSCGGAVQRVFSPAPIVFKGSGYYVTDSRKSSAAASGTEPAKAADGSSSEAAKPAASTSDASATTPAPAPATAKSSEPAA